MRKLFFLTLLLLPALAFPKAPRTMRVRITEYQPMCRKCGTGRYTRTDRDATKTVGVAVDPRVIRLGSRVRILSRGYPHRLFLADDTGGAVKSRHVDLRVLGTTHRHVTEFGVRHVTVEVLPPLKKKGKKR